MTSERLDTAHERWDEWWGQAKQRAHWSEPEPAVVELLQVLQSRGATRVLDVGAGIGRHALAFAAAGFEIIAVDASQTGLDEIQRSASALDLTIEARIAPFTELPVDVKSIDHVLAWNVLYHGDRETVRTAFAECRRVLRDDGSFQLTMLSKRHRAFGVGHEIRPDTFVDKGSKGDKDHPHFYVDEGGLASLLTGAGFALVSLTEVDQNPPGGWHWVALAAPEPARGPVREPLTPPGASGNT